MFHILAFIFFIVLIVLVIGLTILAKIVNTVIRTGLRVKDAATSATGNSRTRTESYTSSDNSTAQTDRPASTRKKVFDSDEGEYVEFEEIK